MTSFSERLKKAYDADTEIEDIANRGDEIVYYLNYPTN